MRGLLMRGLGTRRHVAGLAGPRARRAVAEGEDCFIAGCLQRGLDDELVDAVGLQAGNVLQEIRRLHAGGPIWEFFQDMGGDTDIFARMRQGDEGAAADLLS